MRNRHMAALLAMVILVSSLSVSAAYAQYTTGLPSGILHVQVDGQPIDAIVVPVTSNANPAISGGVDLGVAAIELAIADGDVVRFSAEVNAEGQFWVTAPGLLADGQYSLYINDLLIGVFIVEGAAPEEREPGALLDIARGVPYPADFGESLPGIGFLDGRFYTLREEAARTAAATNDEPPNVRSLERRLAEAGWLQRYENRLASPHPDDPSTFSALVTSFVVEYASGADARSAFTALAGEEPGVAFTTIGNESVLTLLSGAAPDTGAEYQAARLVFRVGPMLAMIVYADLLNQPPDLAILESVAQTVAARAVFVANRQVVPLGSMTLRLNSAMGTGRVVQRDLYDARGGAITSMYNEDEEARSSRADLLSGATDAFSSTTQGRFSQAGTPAGSERESDTPATPELTANQEPEARGGENATIDISMTSELFAFASEEEADAWLTARRDRLLEEIASGESPYSDVTDSPALGDATVTFAIERPIGANSAPGRGFRLYTRTDALVAVVEVISSPGVDLRDAASIMEQQLACIDAEGCAGLAPRPG